MAEKKVEMSSVFGIYSAVENRPVIRAWARSAEEADEKLAALRAQDAKSERGEEDEYYRVQLSQGELEAYQEGGFIPADE